MRSRLTEMWARDILRAASALADCIGPMTVAPKAATALLLGVFAAPLALAQQPAATVAAIPAPTIAHVRWLVELGAESLAPTPRSAAPAAVPVVVSVPGAAYLFDRGSDGRLRKRARLAADSAAANGVAVAGEGLALADRLGTVSLFAVSPQASIALRWRRELGERVTSIGWDGGPLVLAATWNGRLTALSAQDGRTRWSTDIGGRAEAPAVRRGDDVLVATKTPTLLRIDARTGAVRWRVSPGGVVLHAPSLVEEPFPLVLCGTWDGQLSAYQTLTGRLSWSVPLGARLAGAPFVAPGLVAVVTEDGAVRGYDLSGHALWTAPGAALGPATLLWQEPIGAAPRLLSVSRLLVGLNPLTGERLADYPRGAVDELERRFADAMLEGEKTYSAAEKRALQEQEAFEIAGPLFGPARLVSAAGAADELTFGTEEGWAYLFDASSLRPLARYHAGPPVSGAPRLLGGRVVASVGEDVYALDPRTGAVAWRRTLGGEPTVTAGGTALAVCAGGRVSALAAEDGALAWSLKGELRFVTPALPGGEPEASAVPWLVDDGEGGLRALVPPGRFVGDALPVGGDLLAVVATGPRSWLAATHAGALIGVTWEEATGLVEAWRKELGEPLVEVQLAAGRALLRSAGGTLASLDLATREEVWRLALAADDRVLVSPRSGALLLLGRDALRVLDAGSGELKHEQKLELPALAAEVRGELPPAVGLPAGDGVLRWLDRLGRAHETRLGDGRATTTDLGTTLADAAPVEGGFLVATAAGEAAMVVFDREE